MGDGMTRRDREDLAKLARRREKVAKSAADQRSAELRADAEEKIATIYRADDARWETYVAKAKAVVAEMDAELAKVCKEQGVPEQFRPSLDLNYFGRGENSMKERRAELRRVAETRIAAMAHKAKAEIERETVEFEAKLLGAGLESGEARAFLESMPTIEQLMPRLSASEIEASPLSMLAGD